jgi:alpha-tubulin suppressor-like RCC1 family protein
LTNRYVPARVGEANDWAAVAAGAHHTLAIKADGGIWACGWNEYGQLGDGTTVHKSVLVRVGGDNDWAAVAGGDKHTLAIKGGGGLWAWGYNNYGAVGDGTMTERHSPVHVGDGWRVPR